MARVKVLVGLLASAFVWTAVSLHALPAAAHRCAAQFAPSGTVVVDFQVPENLDMEQVILNLGFKGGAAVGPTAVSVQYPSGTSFTLTGPSSDTTGIGDEDGWLFGFGAATGSTALYDYSLSISPEGSNLSTDNWKTDGSGTRTWHVTITYPSDDDYQFNMAISSSLSTPPADLVLTGITPNRQLVAPVVTGAPAAPIAPQETKSFTVTADGLTSPQMKIRWTQTAGGVFSGTLGWTVAGNEVSQSGIFQINPTAAPAAPDFTIAFTTYDAISGFGTAAELKSTATLVLFQVIPPTLHISPPTNLRINTGGKLDFEMALENTGGGTIDIDAVDMPPFEVSTANGYFLATFDNESAGAVDFYATPVRTVADLAYGSPSDLHMRFVAIKPPTAATTLSLETTLEAGPSTTPYDTTQPLTVTVDPRSPPQPFDFIAVLDRSGSMAGASHCPSGGGGSVPKIDGLHSAGQLFYDLMEAIKEPADRTGTVSFNHDAEVEAAEGPIIDPGTGSSRIPAIKTEIAALTPGGSTSISEALEVAVGLFAPAFTGNKGILLMTDGMHNTGTGDTRSFDLEGDFNPAGGEAAVEDVRLHIVGLGDSGNMNSAMLQAMAAGDPASPLPLYRFAPGGYRHTCAADKLGIYFVQALADLFFEARVITDDSAVLPVNGSAHDKTIPINSTAGDVVFYVTWSDPSVEVSFVLSDPQSKVQWRSLAGEGYAHYPLWVPGLISKYSIRPAGPWTMELKAVPSGSGTAPAQVSVEFAALVVDPVLDAKFAVDSAAHTTGEPIALTATLTEGGAPLLGAQVNLYADVPAVGLGDFIYNNQVSGDVQAQIEVPGEPPETVKLAQLLSQMPEGLSRVVLELAMKDDATSGDATAGDGVYTFLLASSGTETQTENNGVYTFTFKAHGSNLLGESFERTKALSDYVLSEPDPARSQAAYYYSSPSTAYLRLTPRDRFRHFVDPVAGRRYQVAPLKPEALDFSTDPAVNLLNGDLLVRLQAAAGSRFHPYPKTRELVGVQTVGPRLPTAALAAKTFHWLFALDVFGGWYALSSTIPVDGGWLLGLRTRFNPGALWGIEPEISLTRPSVAEPPSLLQLGVNVLFNLPLVRYGLRPYLTAGGSWAGFFGFAQDSSSWAAGGGIGVRWYPDWRMKGGLSAEVRDQILFDAYNGGPTHNLQITIGAHAHLF